MNIEFSLPIGLFLTSLVTLVIAYQKLSGKVDDHRVWLEGLQKYRNEHTIDSNNVRLEYEKRFGDMQAKHLVGQGKLDEIIRILNELNERLKDLEKR